jgi:hypothetical protein
MKTPDEKLTLKLKRSSIARAKVAAKQRGTSVSRMVEEYFDHIAPPAPSAHEGSSLTPIVDGLVKMAQGRSLPAGFDWKKDKEERLLKRYGLK